MAGGEAQQDVCGGSSVCVAVPRGGWYSHSKPAMCELLVVLSLKHKFTHVAVITRLILARLAMELSTFCKVFLKVARKLQLEVIEAI